MIINDIIQIKKVEVLKNNQIIIMKLWNFGLWLKIKVSEVFQLNTKSGSPKSVLIVFSWLSAPHNVILIA